VSDDRTKQTAKEGEVHLRLFVAGSTLRSLRAIANVKRMCEKWLADRYFLEVVDIYQQPTQAQTEKIVATPTLIKVSPAPIRYFVGDLTDLSSLVSELNLGNSEGDTP
jgi:circadian clock protein KaiB